MALTLTVIALMVGISAAQLPPRPGSCVAAGSSNCCVEDGICYTITEESPSICYCDSACYTFGDCCYDVAQTCDTGISFTTSGTARSGEAYVLTCSIIVNHNLTLLSIALYDDRTRNTSISRNVTNSDGSVQTLHLEISPLRTSHGGQYTCQVTYNDATLHLPTAVNVEIAAPSVSISQNSPNEPLTVGNSTNLTCTIEFSEAVDTLGIEVNVAWIGPQDVFYSSDSDPILVQEAAVLTYESILQLSSLELSDFGAYTCVASGYPGQSNFITASANSSATLTLVQGQRPTVPQPSPSPSETPSIKDPSSAGGSHTTAIAAGVAAGVVTLIVAASLVGVCILLRKHYWQTWLVGDPAGNQTGGSKKANVQAVSFPNRVPQQSEAKDEDMEIVECTAYGILATPPENTYPIPRQQNHCSVPRQQQESDPSFPRRPQETVYSVPHQVPSPVPPRPAPRPVRSAPVIQHAQLQTTENIYDNPEETNIYEPITL